LLAADKSSTTTASTAPPAQPAAVTVNAADW
jgi:hypothetical protein